MWMMQLPMMLPLPVEPIRQRVNELKFKRHGLVQYNCCRLKTLRHSSKSNMDNYRGYLCLFSFQKRKQSAPVKLVREEDVQELFSFQKHKQEYPANSLTNSLTKFQHQSSLTIFLICNKTWSHSSFGNGSRVKRVDASTPKTCYDIFGYHCLIP